MENKLNSFYIAINKKTNYVWYCNHYQEKDINNEDLLIIQVVMGDLQAKTFSNGKLLYSAQPIQVYKTNKNGGKVEIEFKSFIE